MYIYVYKNTCIYIYIYIYTYIHLYVYFKKKFMEEKVLYRLRRMLIKKIQKFSFAVKEEALCMSY